MLFVRLKSKLRRPALSRPAVGSSSCSCAALVAHGSTLTRRATSSRRNGGSPRSSTAYDTCTSGTRKRAQAAGEAALAAAQRQPPPPLRAAHAKRTVVAGLLMDTIFRRSMGVAITTASHGTALIDASRSRICESSGERVEAGSRVGDERRRGSSLPPQRWPLQRRAALSCLFGVVAHGRNELAQVRVLPARFRTG